MSQWSSHQEFKKYTWDGSVYFLDLGTVIRIKHTQPLFMVIAKLKEYIYKLKLMLSMQ